MTFLPADSLDGFAVDGRHRDDLVPFIGERAVTLFSFAVADEADSVVCATHFRRILIDSGEDPDDPQVTEAEQLLIDWGRRIASDPGSIPDEFYASLEAAFNPQLRGLLLAQASDLVASATFAAAGRVPLDPALYDYRKPGDNRTD